MHLIDSSSLKATLFPKTNFEKVLIKNIIIIAHEINKPRLKMNNCIYVCIYVYILIGALTFMREWVRMHALKICVVGMDVCVCAHTYFVCGLWLRKDIHSLFLVYKDENTAEATT